MQITEIGIVRNNIHESKDSNLCQDIESFIEIHEKYREALYKLDENDYITIIFYFHLSSKSIELQHTNRYGEFKGLFATRTPHRPSPIGMTTVKLINISDIGITVRGLDAIDGTPVLDIKPYVAIFDSKESASFKNKELDHIPRESPRQWIIEKILAADKTKLFQAAGQLHGHYCPGLAIGVLMGIHATLKLRDFTDGIMENLVAIVEMNNCTADGIQYITGCTFGNNALIFEDVGKIAFTLVKRGGKAIRVYLNPNWRDLIPHSETYSLLFDKVVKNREASQEEIDQYRKISRKIAFEMMTIDPSILFSIHEVSPVLPPRAPIHPDIYCKNCGEKAMGSRQHSKNDQILCLKCAKDGFFRLTGHGIEFYKE